MLGPQSWLYVEMIKIEKYGRLIGKFTKLSCGQSGGRAGYLVSSVALPPNFFHSEEV